MHVSKVVPEVEIYFRVLAPGQSCLIIMPAVVPVLSVLIRFALASSGSVLTSPLQEEAFSFAFSAAAARFRCLGALWPWRIFFPLCAVQTFKECGPLGESMALSGRAHKA